MNMIVDKRLLELPPLQNSNERFWLLGEKLELQQRVMCCVVVVWHQQLTFPPPPTSSLFLPLFPVFVAALSGCTTAQWESKVCSWQQICGGPIWKCVVRQAHRPHVVKMRGACTPPSGAGYFYTVVLRLKIKSSPAVALEATPQPSQNIQQIDPHNMAWDLCQIDHFLHTSHSWWHVWQTHLCLNRITFCYQRYRSLFKNCIPHSASTYLLNKVRAIIPP